MKTSRCLRETPRARAAHRRRHLEKWATENKAIVKAKTVPDELIRREILATVIYEQPQPQYEIPRDIVEDTSIGPIERWTFVALLCFELRSIDGDPVTTVARLAKKWCVSRAKMRGHLFNLENAGWIREISHERPRSRWDVRKYKLLRQLPDFDIRQQEKMSTGPPGRKKRALPAKKRSIKTGKSRSSSSRACQQDGAPA